VAVSAGERRELAREARRLFGFDELLPFQAEIMAATRRRQHVLAVLPTGAGKSLCYQLPAFLDDGPTLVISPLIALMKDQIDGLPPTLARRAIAINSSLDGRDLRQAMVDVGKGRYRLVYAAPERLRQPAFLQALRQARVGRLVIDEAHCVSMWGHDFRPDYLVIAQAHAALGSPPILAMTATAPPAVREDIIRRLSGPEAGFHLLVADPYRSNLRLQVIGVKNDDEKRRRLLQFGRETAGSGVIYARSRRRCEEIATLLNDAGVATEHYHAGLSDRDARQDRFMQGQTRVMVATIAFGMGVDKPDIRFILHDGLPDSLEAYTQEIGRAGRDGLPADCILLYSPYDRSHHARRGQATWLDKDWLRRVFGAVKELLAGRNLGPVALTDLTARLAAGQEQVDATDLRVALSVLEQAGLLRRRYDIPRQATLSLSERSPGPTLSRFIQAAGLSPGQTSTLDFLALSQQARLPPDHLESQLLAWEAEGSLTLAASGRQMLIEIGKAPANASARIDSLLSQYAVLQAQRLSEVLGYVAARSCRHGYLANYLGGAGRERCEACDYCLRQRAVGAP
jgi:ATP-dependent DNA helicase RecQ